MVPVEVAAFGLLALCVIVLAIVQVAQLLVPRPLAGAGRLVLLMALIAVVIIAIYVWATTRLR